MNDIITDTPSAGAVSAISEARAVPSIEGVKVSSHLTADKVGAGPPSLDVPSAEEVFAAADKVTAFLQENNSTRTLRISMNDSLDRPVFTVVDSETNEVVRHIPSDEVIAMAEYIEQWIPDAEDFMPQGILFDDLV